MSLLTYYSNNNDDDDNDDNNNNNNNNNNTNNDNNNRMYWHLHIHMVPNPDKYWQWCIKHKGKILDKFLTTVFGICNSICDENHIRNHSFFWTYLMSMPYNKKPIN